MFCRNMYDLDRFRVGDVTSALATGLVISCYSRLVTRPPAAGYQVPPKAASVLASTAAHSSARSSPRVSAIDRTVSGTR